MRDLEKIKAKKVVNVDKGKISLILATAVATGVIVFLVGLLLGLKKPNEAQAAPSDPLDELIAGAASRQGPEENQADEEAPAASYEYATKLAEDSAGDTIAPPLIPASTGDDPMPVEPAWGSGETVAKGAGGFKVPENPGDVAFVEPALSSMSARGEKGIFTLHVNSFSDKLEATAYVTQLRKLGYKAFLVATDAEDRGTIYRVRIGPFLSKNEAEKYRKKFEEAEGIPTYVVKRVVEA